MMEKKQDTEEYEIIRGDVAGKSKYCRVPARSRMAELLQAEGIAELSADKILEMPRDLAVTTIDAILEDWTYWLKRANELFVLWAGLHDTHEAKSEGKKEG